MRSCRVAKFLNMVFINAFLAMKSYNDDTRRCEENGEERKNGTYSTASDSFDLVPDLDWGGDGEGCSAPA